VIRLWTEELEGFEKAGVQTPKTVTLVEKWRTAALASDEIGTYACFLLGIAPPGERHIEIPALIFKTWQKVAI
jgi:hypothetical protein